MCMSQISNCLDSYSLHSAFMTVGNGMMTHKWQQKGFACKCNEIRLKLILVEVETHTQKKIKHVNTKNRQENRSTLFGFFIMKMTLHRWIKVRFHFAGAAYHSFRPFLFTAINAKLGKPTAFVPR